MGDHALPLTVQEIIEPPGGRVNHGLRTASGRSRDAIILRMPSFYTGAGDDGSTGMLGEGRIPKEHPRAEALGALDEAAAALGLARALNPESDIQAVLESMQRHLYQVMAEVAAPGANAVRFRMIGNDQVAWLEAEIDRRGAEVESPGEFLLGGDTPSGGALDLARTVVRRAERRVSLLIHQGEVENRALLAYLNRASSLCFLLILQGYRQAGVGPSLAKGISE